jgi:hypothetical protein
MRLCQMRRHGASEHSAMVEVRDDDRQLANYTPT